MIWVTLGAEAVSWSAWLWQHRQEFEPVLRHVGDVGAFAQAALTHPDSALRRVGNTLVFGQADGGGKILAFIEQTSPRIDSIGRAVDGLQAGQAALSSSLASLQSLSMVTLGLTALTPVVLGAQFVALNRRLTTLEKTITHLHKKFDAAVIANLRAGLGLLRQGQDFLEARDRVNAHHRLTAALPDCIRSMKYFSELLGGELHQKKVNHEEVRLLARHLSVAIAGVACCQIGLEQDQHAFAQSGEELDLLRQAARRVFHDLVAHDPVPYLLPGLRGEHGVTLDFMAQLFQQARDAGALDPARDSSASAWFEEHRDALVRASHKEPFFGSERWYATLKGQLREAVAAVEETNRVVGLSRLVEQVKDSGQNTLGILEQYKQHASGQDADAHPYLAWGFG